MPIAFTIAQTAAPDAAPPKPVETGMNPLILFGGMAIIMWVLMIRPQQKRQKELAARISSLKTGDRVITSGGIHGVVSNVKDGATLILKVDDNCKLEIDKSSVSVVKTKEPKETKEAK
jgi:preprotein translocase subunit YajC